MRAFVFIFIINIFKRGLYFCSDKTYKTESSTCDLFYVVLNLKTNITLLKFTPCPGCSSIHKTNSLNINSALKL